MKPKSHSKLSDARLKALLKGLREDVVAPPDFSARVLKSLRAEGLLPALPETAQEREPWWERFGAQLWARPRWGLALAAGLVLGLTWVWAPYSEHRSCAPSAAVSEAPRAALPPQAAPALALAVSGRKASASVHVLAAHRVRHSFSTELAYSSTNGPAGQASAHSGSASLSSSAPALGQGSSSSGAGTSALRSGLVTAASPLSAASPAGSTGGGNAEFSSYRSSADSSLDKTPQPTPVPTATPQHATPVTTLGQGQNSQVYNNVILASRGQSAKIIYNVTQSGHVLVAVYSRLGRKVAVLQDGNLTPAQNITLYWDGQSDGGLAASGIYEVLIETPTYTDLHKMMLVK